MPVSPFGLNLLIFSLGACIGSFLNVCIYRIPAGVSVVSPRSRCPVCQRQILWYENIPLLSWILLRGRCAGCRTRISLRYPLIEALTGVLFLQVFLSFGFKPMTPVFWIFAALLVAITFIDFDHQIIPDVLSLSGILAGLATSLLTPVGWKNSVFGLLLGGGSLWLVAALYAFLTKKEGMGGGDLKLLAMIGAFLGWKAVLPVIFLSSCFGTVVGVPLMLARRSDGKLAIPFGPFLSAAAIVWLFWGGCLLRWYLDFFSR